MVDKLDIVYHQQNLKSMLVKHHFVGLSQNKCSSALKAFQSTLDMISGQAKFIIRFIIHFLNFYRPGIGVIISN